MERIARLEQVVEQIVGVPSPQLKEDRVDGAKAVPQELVPNAFGEQIGPVPVPQIKEDVSERTQHAHFGREPFEKDGRQYFDCEDSKDLVMSPPLTPIDPPGDQARRDPSEPVQRQGCRYACGDATTGPTDSRCVEDRETHYEHSGVCFTKLLGSFFFDSVCLILTSRPP